MSGSIGVTLLNRHSGMSVTGEPLSIMNLIGTLLTNSVALLKSFFSFVLFSGFYRFSSYPLLPMMLFYQRIVLGSLICTSFHNGLFFYSVSAICTFLLGKCAVSTSLVPRTVHIGYLFVFAFDNPVFSLYFPHRVFPSIFVCTVVLVRVLFSFLNCLNHLIGRTCVHVSVFFYLICRLWIGSLMLKILLLLHSQIRSSFPHLVFSSKRLLLFYVFLLLSQSSLFYCGICSIPVLM